MLPNAIRPEILKNLQDGGKSVGGLVSSIGVRQANLSQHLGELRKRKPVRELREGNNVIKVTHPKTIQACDLIREVVLSSWLKVRS